MYKKDFMTKKLCGIIARFRKDKIKKKNKVVGSLDFSLDLELPVLNCLACRVSQPVNTASTGVDTYALHIWYAPFLMYTNHRKLIVSNLPFSDRLDRTRTDSPNFMRDEFDFDFKPDGPLYNDRFRSCCTFQSATLSISILL